MLTVTSPLLLAQSSEDVPLIADDVTLSEGLQALSVFVATILLTIVLRRILVRALDREANHHLGGSSAGS